MRGGKEIVCAWRIRVYEGASARARALARRQLVGARARAPADAGTDRIDNNLSLKLLKLVDALVVMQQHW
jgi:hypothetical protein